tara:strand:+ start:480 stop:863 length:384 start_codon:yes stop_codon:yes gene_type:complete
MEFGDFLIYFGIGWVISNLVLGLLAFLLRRHIERSMEKELSYVGQALNKEQLIALTVEIDDNQYFCYNSITNDFVCQGSDLTEIRERFRARYPDKDAAIYDGDATAVATLKSQLKELKKQNENSISI